MQFHAKKGMSMLNESSGKYIHHAVLMARSYRRDFMKSYRGIATTAYEGTVRIRDPFLCPYMFFADVRPSNFSISHESRLITLNAIKKRKTKFLYRIILYSTAYRLGTRCDRGYSNNIIIETPFDSFSHAPRVKPVRKTV